MNPGPSPRERISRRSLDRQAADILRGWIIDGRLAQGERLTEAGLAAQVEVSRSTIRTALQHLTTERLVVKQNHSGWSVTQITRQGASDLYTLREVLEGTSARLAAQRITPQRLEGLQTAFGHLQRAFASSDRRELATADLEFHRAVILASGNDLLVAQHQLFEGLILLYLVTTTRMYSTNIVDAHRDIMDAIMAGDPNLAERSAREHIRYYSDLFIGTLGDS